MLKKFSRHVDTKILDRKKVAAGFIVVVLIIIALAISSNYHMSRTIDAYNTLFQNPLVIANTAKTLKIHFKQVDSLIANVLDATSVKQRVRTLAALKENAVSIHSEYQVLFKQVAASAQPIKKSRDLYLQWRMLRTDFYQLIADVKLSEANTFSKSELLNHRWKIIQDIDVMGMLAAQEVVEFRAKSIVVSNNIIFATVALSLLAILCVGYLMSEVWRAILINENHRSKRQGLMDEHILMAVFDKQGTVEEVSSSLCRFFGCSPRQLIEDQKKFFLSDSQQDKLLEKNILHKLSQGKSWRGEICYLSAQGISIWADSSIIPNRDENRNIIGYTNILHDLTNKKLANIDKLTGLLNRRSYDEILIKQISLAVRNKYPIALAILDIDYFKRFNDLYGHPEGDKALSFLSVLLKKRMQRSNDFVFRIGGEEFALVISGFEEDKILSFLNSVREEVKALNITNRNSSVSPYLTVSIGAAVLNQGYVSEQRLYKTADLALYEAKVTRDKVVVNSLISNELKSE
ncbi:MAG: sensor domain-containing diguanylate cyclase [Oceanospirillaceae bacterium]